MSNNKQFMVLDAIGNPLARKSDEAIPFIFYGLSEAVKFVNEELEETAISNRNAISIIELNYLETLENKEK